MVRADAQLCRAGGTFGSTVPGCTRHFLVFPSCARARAMSSSATDVQQFLDELCMFNCTDVISFQCHSSVISHNTFLTAEVLQMNRSQRLPPGIGGEACKMAQQCA